MASLSFLVFLVFLLFNLGILVSKFLQEHLQASLVTFGNQPDVKVTTRDP